MTLEQDYTFQYKDTGLQLNRDLFPGQAGIPGAVNLVLNPSVEGSDGTTVVRQNLVTNPTARVHDSTVVVRENLVTNPRPRNYGPSNVAPPGWSNQWSGGGASGAEFTSDANGVVRREWTAPAENNHDVFYGPAEIPVTPGDRLSAKLEVRIAAAPGGMLTDRIRLLARFRDASNALVGDVYGPGLVSTPWGSVGEWLTLENNNVVAPAGATKVQYIPFPTDPNNGLPGVGFVIEERNPIVERREVVGDFFDGDTAATGPYSYGWKGIAGTTPSEERAPTAARWRSFSLPEDGTVLALPDGGARLLCLSSLSSPLTGIANTSNLSITSGTATVVFRLKASGGQVRVDIGARAALDGTYVTYDVSASQVIQPDEETVMHHVIDMDAIGANQVEPTWRMTTDPMNIPGLGIDALEVAVIDGYYEGDPFSGSTPAAGDFTYNWIGAENASVSEQRAPKLEGQGFLGFGVPYLTRDSIAGMYSLALENNTNLVNALAINMEFDARGRIDIPSDSVVTVLATVRNEDVDATTVRIDIGDYLRDRTYLGYSLGAELIVPPGEEAEYRFFYTPRAGTEALRLVPYALAISPGRRIVWDNFLVVEGEYNGPYFDGSFPGEHYVDQNFTLADSYYWTGEPHASTSVYTGQPELSVGDTLFDVERVNGLDSADTRLTERVREGMDGGFADAEFENMRTIVIDGTAYGSADTLLSVLEELKANYAPGKNSNPFYLRAPGIGERVIFAKALGARYNWEQALRTGKAPFQIQLKAEDPTIYGDAISLTTGVAVVSTGRGYNKSYNYGYGGVSGSGGSVNARNSGTKPVSANIRLQNVTDPSIVHDTTGARLDFGITLGDGDWLDIDLRNRTVRLNGSANRRGTLKGGSRWFLLEVGDNALRFLGNPAGTGEPTMTITYRPGYR